MARELLAAGIRTTGRARRWWPRCGHHAQRHKSNERSGMAWNEWICSRAPRLRVPMSMPWIECGASKRWCQWQTNELSPSSRTQPDHLLSCAVGSVLLLFVWFLCSVQENPLFMFFFLEYVKDLCIIVLRRRVQTYRQHAFIERSRRLT
jgi:hypothetical protein